MMFLQVIFLMLWKMKCLCPYFYFNFGWKKVKLVELVLKVFVLNLIQIALRKYLKSNVKS